MIMYRHVSRILHLLLLIILLGTCGSTVYFIKTEPSLAPATDTTFTSTPTSVPVPVVLGTPEIIPNTDWSLLQPGLERRVINIQSSQNQLVESVYIWRIDQNYFRMDVAFDENPKSLETWQNETSAAIVLNGGYYSIVNERYFPDGLIVVGGTASGRSFNRSAGMLAINGSRAELRSLVEKPYNSFEPLQAALQSFPILVEPGGRLGFGAERESHASARRTVIAQDREGRILFIVAPLGYFTLHQLSVYLTESDLNLDIAINLDGGGSTGIFVANSQELISSSRPLPFVILVYAR
jgi:hypothetical protein